MIGRQFPVRVLERVVERRRRADDRTTTAARHPRGEGPHPPRDASARSSSTCSATRSSRTRPTASLLKQERRELHGQVGEALEELYPERAGELAPVLAMHFEQAGETEQGDRLLRRRAPSTRSDQYAIQEAFAAFDRAASLIDQEAAAGRRRAAGRRGATGAAGAGSRSSSAGRTAGYSFRAPEETFDALERIVARRRSSSAISS